MKQIQPITFWANGQQLQAGTFSMYISNDDLVSSATFYYQVLSVTNNPDGGITAIPAAQGYLYMNGAEYEAWGQTSDINEAAYIWGAQQLNLTLITPPEPPAPTPEEQVAPTSEEPATTGTEEPAAPLPDEQFPPAP